VSFGAVPCGFHALQASLLTHSLRHTLALALDRAKVSPNDAAALLGHTVEVYLSTYLPTSGTSGIVRAAEALGRVAAAE
jgi:integrase